MQVVKHSAPLFLDAERLVQPELLLGFVGHAFSTSVMLIAPFCLLAFFGAVSLTVLNRLAPSVAHSGTFVALRIPLLIVALLFSIGSIQQSFESSLAGFPDTQGHHG